MNEPRFFRRAGQQTIADIVAWTGATAPEGANLDVEIRGVAPIEAAAPGDLVFLDNAKYVGELATSRASACLLPAACASKVGPGTVALVSAAPYRAFATAVARLFPESARPGSMFGAAGVAPGAHVHGEAVLEHGVIVDPGAVVGPRAVIGAGTVIGANAVIGPDVRVGRNCSIGAHVTLQHVLVGDHVIIHPGARIGQDGFGFAMGPRGHLKVPQVGRVIVQDHVEIGANTTIDRGANRDTMIGEGSKIDNLVQIGHNVTIGRHCVIVSQVGIAGSSDLGDFVALGGQAGVAGHLKIGAGAQLAAQSGVMTDVPAGGRWGGAPAMPMREFFRRLVELDKLAARAVEGKSKRAAAGEPPASAED